LSGKLLEYLLFQFGFITIITSSIITVQGIDENTFEIIGGLSERQGGFLTLLGFFVGVVYIGSGFILYKIRKSDERTTKEGEGKLD
jgi:hypothetical protein